MSELEDKLNNRVAKILQEGKSTPYFIETMRNLVGMAVNLEKRARVPWITKMVESTLDRVQDAVEEIEAEESK